MLYTTLLLAVLVGTVTAFAPMGAKTVCPSLVMAKKQLFDASSAVKEVGVSAPLGFFDPLGFSKGADPATMAKYREAELKHGRVAMLAVFGVLTAERFHPFYNGKLSGDPLKAFMETPPIGFVQIIAFIGLLEYTFAEAAKGKGYAPGDYYGIGARIPDENDKAWVGFQTRELNNGRLAMFGILGELAHSAITGEGPLQLFQESNPSLMY